MLAVEPAGGRDEVLVVELKHHIRVIGHDSKQIVRQHLGLARDRLVVPWC